MITNSPYGHLKLIYFKALDAEHLLNLLIWCGEMNHAVTLCTHRVMMGLLLVFVERFLAGEKELLHFPVSHKAIEVAVDCRKIELWQLSMELGR